MAKRHRNPAVNLAESLGWTVTKSKGKGGHMRAVCPHGCCILFLASTPSDWRTPKNDVAAVKACAKRRSLE